MSVFGVIQSECGKTWIRITPNTDTFHAANCIRLPLRCHNCITLHDIIFLLCECSQEIGFTKHFFLCRHIIFFYAITFRTTFMNGLRDIDSQLLSCDSNDLFRVMLYDCTGRFDSCANERILTATVKYIKMTQKILQTFLLNL